MNLRRYIYIFSADPQRLFLLIYIYIYIYRISNVTSAPKILRGSQIKSYAALLTWLPKCDAAPSSFCYAAPKYLTWLPKCDAAPSSFCYAAPKYILRGSQKSYAAPKNLTRLPKILRGSLSKCSSTCSNFPAMLSETIKFSFNINFVCFDIYFVCLIAAHSNSRYRSILNACATFANCMHGLLFALLSITWYHCTEPPPF